MRGAIADRAKVFCPPGVRIVLRPLAGKACRFKTLRECVRRGPFFGFLREALSKQLFEFGGNLHAEIAQPGRILIQVLVDLSARTR